MDAKKEIRSIDCQLSIREAGGDAQGEQSRTIVGTAIVFNTESELLDDWGMRFREVIAPSACQKEWLDTQDIKLNLLHDRDMTLARNNKNAENASLRLTVTGKGVDFEFEAPKCDLGDRALELVRTGVYSGCSFEFYPQDYDVEERADKSVLITHRKFKALSAITIGMDPAYMATSVNARELYDNTDAGKQEIADAEREKQERIAADMQRRAKHMKVLSKFDTNF